MIKSKLLQLLFRIKYWYQIQEEIDNIVDEIDEEIIHVKK